MQEKNERIQVLLAVLEAVEQHPTRFENASEVKKKASSVLLAQLRSWDDGLQSARNS